MRIIFGPSQKTVGEIQSRVLAELYGAIVGACNRFHPEPTLPSFYDLDVETAAKQLSIWIRQVLQNNVHFYGSLQQANVALASLRIESMQKQDLLDALRTEPVRARLQQTEKELQDVRLVLVQVSEEYTLYRSETGQTLTRTQKALERANVLHAREAAQLKREIGELNQILARQRDDLDSLMPDRARTTAAHKAEAEPK